ncbi:UNVERIFIED_CONTAM: hypothetical protein PYX00_000914 [Menopon gallinae]|uniref:Uncharacterized protein n=1 Tax=Menopon gallinae TaxID=328185 RepID=A0AAW2IC39_9NEOP
MKIPEKFEITILRVLVHPERHNKKRYVPTDNRGKEISAVGKKYSVRLANQSGHMDLQLWGMTSNRKGCRQRNVQSNVKLLVDRIKDRKVSVENSPPESYESFTRG